MRPETGPAVDLSDIRNHVRAISFIHEKLQNTDDVTHIHIKLYSGCFSKQPKPGTTIFFLLRIPEKYFRKI